MLFENLINDAAPLSAVLHASSEERVRPFRRLGDAEAERGYQTGWEHSGAFSFIQTENRRALTESPEAAQGRIINFMV